MGTPYRVPVDRSIAPPAPGVLARRASLASAWPQVVLAATFVLPVFQECGHPKSPADYAGEGVAAGAAVVVPFALALVLAVVTLIARRLRRPPWLVASMGVGTVLGLYALGAFIAVMADAGPGLTPAAFVVGFGAVAVVTCVGIGMNRRGWAQWGWMARAHLVTATPFGVFFATSIVAENENALVGAYVYVVAFLALVAIHARWLRAIRLRSGLRRRAS